MAFNNYEERFIISRTYYQARNAGLGMFKSPFENGEIYKRGFQEVILIPPCPPFPKAVNNMSFQWIVSYETYH